MQSAGFASVYKQIWDCAEDGMFQLWHSLDLEA